jgi:hypothetical protein
MNFPARVYALCFSLLLLTLTASAQDAERSSQWTELQRPPVGKGLLMEPRLLSVGSKVHCLWSGTTEEIRTPEIFHAHISGSDTEWKSARAPFFGKNKGRVRKVAVGKTRNLMGLLFQRSLTQGNDAYEVLLAISGDQGWSWSNTIEIDSFVGDKTGGTNLSIEGRQGSNRPEFAMAWGREYGNLRAANFDISSSLRPEGTLVGVQTPGAMKADVGALGKDGFSVVFNSGPGLSTAHVRALVGKIEEGTTFLRGRFGEFFSVASRPYGPSRLAVGTGKTVEAYTSNETSWKNDSQAGTLPFDASGVSVESDMDDKKNLHLVMLRSVSKTSEIWYMGQKDKKWGQPELVYTFDDKVDMRGFDIAAADDFIFIAASRGFEAKFFRRSLK